jgi:hypothetical protein
MSGIFSTILHRYEGANQLLAKSSRASLGRLGALDCPSTRGRVRAHMLSTGSHAKFLFLDTKPCGWLLRLVMRRATANGLHRKAVSGTGFLCLNSPSIVAEGVLQVGHLRNCVRVVGTRFISVPAGSDFCRESLSMSQTLAEHSAAPTDLSVATMSGSGRCQSLASKSVGHRRG